jgi:NADH-dependent peroxiredoxin subunit C
MLKINEKIPDFDLEIFYKNKINKTSLYKLAKDKWLVVLFYPADFTFICPTELEEAANFYSEFKKANTQILSISTDTAWTHKAWHDGSKAI